MKRMNIIINCLRCATFLFGLAVLATSAVAQNLQGPGALNYGAGSSPQTGGVVSQAPTLRTNAPNRQSSNFHNYARSNKMMASHQATGHATQ
jgi:hypothetical protein